MSSPTPSNPYHPIKAVAIDLDGTLIAHDQSISDENRAALEALHAADVEIILASGRQYVAMLPTARKLPMVRYMVSSQGAYASDVDNTQTIFEAHLPKADADAAIQFGLDHNLAIAVYTESGIQTVSTGPWIERYAQLVDLKPNLTTREAILAEHVFKVSYFESKERLDEIQQSEFIRNSHLSTVRSMDFIFEQAKPKVSKASGLAPLIERLGIRPQELATFGDQNNDVPMFEFSGFSAAMTDASPAAKIAATLTSPPGPQETSFSRAVEAMKTYSF
ncbi:MAG: HAD family hydrolase [Verrucomicrobiota bacterium]